MSNVQTLRSQEQAAEVADQEFLYPRLQLWVSFVILAIGFSGLLLNEFGTPQFVHDLFAKLY